jgi:ASC-1-like (ASCH) protein
MIKAPCQKPGNCTTYHNHRAEPYFTFVKQGKKTIEGRIRKGYYRLIKPGDHIIIFNEEETDNLEVLVKRVAPYESIWEMLKAEPLKKIVPDAKSIDDGVQIYRRFYTEEQEKEFGVVAIEIKKTPF